MATDNFCYAFAGVALVTYMSSLTSLGYTATQYALLSSTYTLFGKFLKGFSGAVVDGLNRAERSWRRTRSFISAQAQSRSRLLFCA